MKKVISIFGSTGNLMYKKLLPALTALLEKKYLDKDTFIYLIARRDWTLEDYINNAKKEMMKDINWDILKPHLNLINMDITNLDDYFKLNETINKIEGKLDKMFYLAVPPKLFPVIAKGLSESKLVQKNDEFARIVFEKPFGETRKSAEEINAKLWQYFEEFQIYRIDHYLGKEMIQNVLVVRFANIIFEQAWDKNTIRNIVILAKEKEGIFNRGNYYDLVGALKDMVQSHLMQMVALITMEKPKEFTSEYIKNEKVEVIKKLKIKKEDIILGQYSTYKNVKNINLDSTTETFVYAKAFIDNAKWEGVPIHLITGKMLDEKRSEIIINFKNDNNHFKTAENNKLVINVAPVEGVNFFFNVKEAGLDERVVKAKLDYCHTCEFSGNTPEAYEKLLLDLVNKQNSLFTRWDEIENSWRIIDEIKNQDLEPFIYNDYQELKEKIIMKNEEIKNDL